MFLKTLRSKFCWTRTDTLVVIAGLGGIATGWAVAQKPAPPPAEQPHLRPIRSLDELDAIAVRAVPKDTRTEQEKHLAAAIRGNWQVYVTGKISDGCAVEFRDDPFLPAVASKLQRVQHLRMVAEFLRANAWIWRADTPTPVYDIDVRLTPTYETGHATLRSLVDLAADTIDEDDFALTGVDRSTLTATLLKIEKSDAERDRAAAR